MALSQEDVDAYKNSLKDLHVNSKPVINMLTMLAEDHEHHAPEIVSVIEEHITKSKPERKLPALYLIDSVMKNLGTTSYKSLFAKNIVSTFCSVFEQVDERTRASMYKLRQTWSSILPNQKLYMIDVKINSTLDPAWPITAKAENAIIHVNPKFLQGQNSEGERSSPDMQSSPEDDAEMEEVAIRQKLIAKQHELLKLQEARLQLELAEAEEKMKMKKQHHKSTTITSLPMPSLADAAPLPETVAPPQDPRQRPKEDPSLKPPQKLGQRPTDPRLRDPRIKRSEPDVPSQTSFASNAQEIPPSSMQPYSMSQISSYQNAPSGPGQQFTPGPEVHGHGSFPDNMPNQFPGPMAFQSQGHGHFIPPSQGQGHWQAFAAPAQPGQSFKGEVFSPRFSDENDSDSSRSSSQDVNARQLASMESRDPRQKMNDSRHGHQSDPRRSVGDPRHSISDPRVNMNDVRVKQSDQGWGVSEVRSKHGGNPQTFSPDGHDSSQGFRSSARNKPVDPRHRSQSDLKHTPDKDIHSKLLDKNNSSTKHIQHRSDPGRRSKEKEIKHVKEIKPEITKHPTTIEKRSTEKDSTADTKLKDAFEAERQKRVEENQRAEKRTSKGKPEERFPGSNIKERERSPLQRSPKQYSRGRTNQRDGAGDRRGDSLEHKSSRETIEKNLSKELAVKKDTTRRSGESKKSGSDSKSIAKSRRSDPGPGVKKTNSNSSVSEKSGVKVSKSIDNVSNKKLGKVSESVDVVRRQTRKSAGKEAEKRARSRDQEDLVTLKKPKLEPVSSESEDFDETNIPEQNFPEDSDMMPEENFPEENMEVDNEVSSRMIKKEIKIEDDISDLFGGEDEDFRSVGPKGLPLESPRGKAWDTYKADRCDMFRDDIERKKHRHESVAELKPRLDEPQDIDFRVGQPEPEQTSPTMEISSDQHTEILLQAHQRLQAGKITPEQHQELLSQLGKLVQIRQLQQEQDRRLSTDGVTTLQPPSDSDLQSPTTTAQEHVAAQVTKQELDTDRPPERFKIPKKSQESKISEDDSRKELRNLYPESPVHEFGTVRFPGADLNSQNSDSFDVSKMPILHSPNDRDRFDGPPERRSRTAIDEHSNESSSRDGTSDFRKDGPADLRKEGHDDFRKDGPHDLRIEQSEFRSDGSDFRNNGPPDIRRGGPQDFRRDGPPDLRNDSDFRKDGPPFNDDHSFRREGPTDSRDDPGFRRDVPPFRDDPGFNRDGPQFRDDPDFRRDGPPFKDDPGFRRDGPLDRIDDTGFRRDGPSFRDDQGLRRDGPPDMRDDPGFKREGLPFRDDTGFRRDGPLDRRDEPGFRIDGPPDIKEDPGLKRDGPPFRDDPGFRRDCPPFRDEPGFRRDGPQLRDDPGFRRDGPPLRDDPGFRRDDSGFRRDGSAFRDEPDFRRDGPPNLRDDPGFKREGPDMRRDRPHDYRQDGHSDFRREGPPGFWRDGSPDRRVGSDFDKDRGPPGRFEERRVRGRGRGNFRDQRGAGRTEKLSSGVGGPGVPGPPDSWRDDKDDRRMGSPREFDMPEPGHPRSPGRYDETDPRTGLPPWNKISSPMKDRERRREFDSRNGPDDWRSEDRPHGDRFRHEDRFNEGGPRDDGFGKGHRFRHEERFQRGRARGRSHFNEPKMMGQRGGPRGPGSKMQGSRNEDFMPASIPDIKPVNVNELDSFIDKFGDPRFRCFADMGPQVSEEVVIGRRNFEIKLGAPPRKVLWDSMNIEVFADPARRGIVIDGHLVYKFGERVKDIEIRGRKEKIFYLGRPVNLWIDGQLFEVRVDSPPKSVEFAGKPHKIQIDGRDMMILIDKNEIGKYGGEPRYVFFDEKRVELRFDPPPRTILIDGKSRELQLNMQQPCVNIDGVLHGIRFDGCPRDVYINGKQYKIHTDHAAKLRVGNRYHYVALGGPCHEIIIDGKWFELKFNEPPKEVALGNNILMVRLPGPPPDVKILPPIGPPGPMIAHRPNMPPGLPLGPMMLPGPGPNLLMDGPLPPQQRAMGPPPVGGVNMGSSMPVSGPVGMPPVSMAPIQNSAIIPGLGPTLGPVSQPTSMSGVFSTLFGVPPSTGPPGFAPPAPAGPTGPLDINSLLDNLVKTGLIKKEADNVKTEPVQRDVKSNMPRPMQKEPEKFSDIPDLTALNIVNMKSLHMGALEQLYAGMQCTSCGQRFNTEDDVREKVYRKHLDWHFRQNRKEKDDMKVTQCRKWYYIVEDWVQFEEVVEDEDIGKSSFFEQQKPPGEGTPAKSSLSLPSLPDGASVIKCPKASGVDTLDMCTICQEPFELFWDEEMEEWRLREAIRVNGKSYHPICFEDHTDASEGTPSPSVLKEEPKFAMRKSLHYEEASIDEHHKSFEDERQIQPQSDASTDNVDGTSTSLTAASTYDVKQVHVKHESGDSGNAADNNDTPTSGPTSFAGLLPKQLSSSQEDPTDNNSASQSADLDTKPDVNVYTKTEPMDTAEDATMPTNTNLSEQIEVKTEVSESMDTSDNKNASESHDQFSQDQISSAAELNQSQESVTPETTAESNAELTDDSVKPLTVNTVTIKKEPVSPREPITEPDVQSLSVTPVAIKTEVTTPTDTETEINVQSTIDKTTEVEPSVGMTDALSVITSGGTTETAEQLRLKSGLSPRSYSLLSKANLAVKKGPVEITPDVLEIESNASTPTRDELPSP
ncbi:uncharacterized protein LOC128227101 [Mya arenaria]|uniref:uncharacterized protein LOC128227101 n=1 Tax=Mya arenaria TaxID=6604 RepID=UPI0022DF123C|nr:uncharacterized protein LOC128227101 [Mya arenaria]